MKLRIALPVLLVLFGVFQGAASGGTDENAAQKLSRVETPSRDVGDPGNKALYCVGYAHLDTQWRWDFVTTIDEYIRSTLDDNFALFEKYPEYVFNFTGSVRYEMMREYYPERYEKLKQYIKEGRWFVSGSSVDEGDVNVPSPESIIRQVLYGNLYFKREFGKVSSDYMLPDCFGFPASMPSIWAHCGLLGFSTQKLTWGSAVGIPFPVGVWEGLDGSSVLAHTLIENDLVDEYSLLVYPLVLGGGKKLFPAGAQVNLKLVESKPFPSGVVLMRYQPA